MQTSTIKVTEDMATMPTDSRKGLKYIYWNKIDIVDLWAKEMVFLMKFELTFVVSLFLYLYTLQ